MRSDFPNALEAKAKRSWSWPSEKSVCWMSRLSSYLAFSASIISGNLWKLLLDFDFSISPLSRRTLSFSFASSNVSLWYSSWNTFFQKYLISKFCFVQFSHLFMIKPQERWYFYNLPFSFKVGFVYRSKPCFI